MADYRNYWEDTLGTEVQGGELDITADSYLQGADLSRSQRADYETRFIDEVYGTDDAQADTWMQRNEDGLLNSSWESGMDITWGLDLRRVLNDDLKVGTTEHYEWLTRGQVDWASYADDNAYRAAFDKLHKEDGKTYSDLNWTDFTDQASEDTWSEQQRVDFIRDANAAGILSGDEEDDKWDIPDNFDNKYTAKYYHDGDNKGQPVDPEAVQPYTPTNLFDPNSKEIRDRIVGADGKPMTIRRDVDTPSAFGGPRDVQGTAWRAGINLKPVNVKKPTNIPSSWGSVTGGNN